MSPIGRAQSIIVGILIFLFKTNSHMHNHHLVIIYGENRPVCSILSPSVLFSGAETIWHVVIRPCGGISRSSRAHSPLSLCVQ